LSLSLSPLTAGNILSSRLQAMGWLEQPGVKWFLPLPILALLGPVIWRFFRGTWRTLDEEALAFRRELAARNQIDHRPAVALTLAAVILTLQHYFGRPSFYREALHDLLARHVDVDLYDELYLRLWWVLARIVGYLAPLAIWPLVFKDARRLPGDGVLDFGLRGRGFAAHAWIYALCVSLMVPLLLLVSRQPDFGAYYPIYKLAGRSWLDFFVWEAGYLSQFLALEIFFRGFLLQALRGSGAGAIWVMVVPYCMIHYGKPYFEVTAAIVAAVVLGSLAMRTRSIYAGFLTHATVALLMDVLALYRRGALPVLLTPLSTRHVTFLYWRGLFWLAWGGALAVLALKARHSWSRRAASIASVSNGP
jgi:membrane protease YdiL (CAAX protease family)